MASKYKLNIKMSKEDLELISGAGKRVVLVKENPVYDSDVEKQSGAVIENKKIKNKSQED